MIQLDGIKILENQLPKLEIIGSILYEEFSSTIIYKDDNNEPYIKEWIDCSEDSSCDRFFTYKISKNILKHFLEGKLSHSNTIKNAENQQYYFIDINKNDTLKDISLLNNQQFPQEYLIDEDVFYTDEFINIDIIFEAFDLDNVEDYNSESFERVKQIADDSSTETINLHLLHGKNVGYGSVNTHALGNVLLKFNDLYYNIALDNKLGAGRGDKVRKADPNYETEVYCALAASYSILLRPKHLQTNLLIDNSTIKKIFTLLNSSSSINILKDLFPNYSSFSIGSYKDLLSNLSNRKLDIELNWYSPFSKVVFHDRIDFKEAELRLANLLELKTSNDLKIERKGKFRSVNCDSGHFKFMSTESEQFSGYFEALVREATIQINFVDTYKVTIVREITKEAGRSREKIKDIITAFTVEIEK